MTLEIGKSYPVRGFRGRTAEVLVILPPDKAVLSGQTIGARVVLHDDTPIMMWFDQAGRGHADGFELDLIAA